MYGFKTTVKVLYTGLAGIALCGVPVTAQTEQGQGRPLIKRYPGSEIRNNPGVPLFALTHCRVQLLRSGHRVG